MGIRLALFFNHREGKEPANPFLILRVVGVFPRADLFAEIRTALEKHNQQQASGNTPVEPLPACSDAEQVKTDPDRLLGKIIGVA